MHERHPLAEAAEQHPDEAALFVDGSFLCWGELWAQVRKHAGYLRAQHLAPGSVVALQPTPSVQALVWLHALWLADFPVMLVNPQATATELDGLIGAYSIGALLSQDEATEAAVPTIPWQPDEESRPHEEDTVRMDAPRFLVLTSGTTGLPKAVPLTGAQLATHAATARLHLNLQPSDCWLACLPFHHIGGLSVVLRAAFLGCRLHLQERFEATQVNHLLDEGGVTHASLVPTMLYRLLENRGARPFTSTVRCLLIGGAPASADLLERARRLRAPLALTYGLTEACSQVTTLRPEAFLRGEASAGQPLPCTEVTLRTAAGHPVSGDEPGEILVRGPTVLTAYHPTVHPPYHGSPDCRTADGWFRTGDWGRWDQQGALHILDRGTDLILSGGENVYPSEIEATLRKHPQVIEAAVVGVPHPEWGQAVMAFVEVRDAACVDSLSPHCRAWLARHKVPKRFVVVQALPRTASGKIRREALREQAAAGDASESFS